MTPSRPPDPDGRPTPVADPSRETIDRIGTVVAGRYRIVERLGSGAMGEVYLGEHLKIGRRDAIKLLTSANARDPESVARFIRGARNLARIRHPNVCTVYDFGETEDGVQFLAIEYVPGGTLGDLVDRVGPLPEARALPLAVQIAEGLQAAHDQGIVHRDLKPDNVMLACDRNGRDVAKVVDFDIAKARTDEELAVDVTRHGKVVGTPQYMSPEQLTGDPLDGRSDLYSLGVLVFWMLTGRLPFEGESARELMLARLTGRARSLNETAPGRFSPDLVREVARALEPDVADRHEAVQTFAQALRSLAPEDGAATPGARGGTTVLSAVSRPSGAASEAGAPPSAMRPSPDGAPASTHRPGRRTEPGSPGRLESGSRPIQPTTLAPALAVRTSEPRSRSSRRWMWVSGTVAAGVAGLLSALAIPGGPGSPSLPPASTPAFGAQADEPQAMREPGAGSMEAGLDASTEAGTPAADALSPASEPADSGPAPARRVGTDGPAGASTPPALDRSVADGQDSSPRIASGTGNAPVPGRAGASGLTLERRDALNAMKGFAAELAPQNVSVDRAGTLLDSARAVWSRSELGEEVRHWSAYVACLAELNQSNPQGAEGWIDRALALDPDNAGYRAVRDALDRGRR